MILAKMYRNTPRVCCESLMIRREGDGNHKQAELCSIKAWTRGTLPSAYKPECQTFKSWESQMAG